MPRVPAEGRASKTQKGVSHPEDEALGRSRGELTTKLHLACDGRSRPLSVVVTPGQRHESTQLEAVLDAIRVKRPGGASRPSKRPEQLIADRGYSYPSCRLLFRRRGIRHTIPERRDQREQRAGRPGAPPVFDLDIYRKRNLVRRCVDRFKQWRSIATRYEKQATNYRAMVVIAALMIWLSS